MAHTITLNSSIKSWDEWIATKDISILADYPECAGKTLEEIVTEGVEERISRQKEYGLISHEHSEETGLLELVWESAEHEEAARDLLLDRVEGNHGVPALDNGVQEVGPNGGAVYFTPFGYLQYLFRKETNT